MNYAQFDEYNKNIRDAAAMIRSKSPWIPQTCIVLGSGLSLLSESLTEKIEIPYQTIPGFPEVTVSGHEGTLIIGNLNNIPVLLLKGRFHYYEGHPIENVVFPIRVMKELDVKNLILTNAAGGINPSIKPGDLMIIKDHIGFFCESPLRGKNFDQYGPRFPDQSKVYHWKEPLHYAKQLDIPSYAGVYAYAKGPMYETPSEINFLSIIGADAVGMSTVPEAIVGSHADMHVIGISCITNYAAGITDQPLSHKEVMEIGRMASENMKKLIVKITEARST